MLRTTIDRYVFKEILPPFFLALLIFTFLLVLPPVMDYLENLLAKGVTWGTAARILWTLLPQALGLTIPMAVLVGILIGLGRMSGDRESVALLACGVSPYRLLRPIGALALHHDGRDRLRDDRRPSRTPTRPSAKSPSASSRRRVETDIQPRVFYQEFPGWVLYPREDPDPGQPGWKKLMVARTEAGETDIYFAERGRLVVDKEKRAVDLVLSDGYIYKTGKGETATTRFTADMVLGLNPNDVFPKVNLQPGLNEKTIAQLREDADVKRTKGAVAAPRSHRHPAEVLVPGGVPGVRAHRPRPRPDGRPRRQDRQLRHRRPRHLCLLHRHVPVGIVDEGALPEHVPDPVDAEHPPGPFRRRSPHLAGAVHRRPPADFNRRGDAAHREGPRPVAAPGSGCVWSGNRADGPPPGRRPSGQGPWRGAGAGDQAAAPPLSRAWPARSVYQPDLHQDCRAVVLRPARPLLHLHVPGPLRQDFQGADQCRGNRPAAGLPDAAVRLLCHPDCRAARRPRDLRPAVTQHRADGHESLRHQPVPRLAVGHRALAGVQRR